jgi:predicted PurR-regulated permease PerM
MLKDKLDYKLLNCAIIMFIIYLLYKTGNLWLGIIGKIWNLFFPFLLAFVIAYALYPIVSYLKTKGIPKLLSIIFIVIVLFAILIVSGVIVVPLLFNQLSNLFSSIMYFINELSFDSAINISGFEQTLSNSFNSIIEELGKFVSNGTVKIIGGSLSYLSTLLISFAAAMYFLADMENIRKRFKRFLNRHNKKLCRFVILLDKEMRSYLTGFVKIMIISLFEYSIAYTIIGHPNAILLGCLAIVAQLIPYFGGICNNIVAAVTAFVISPALFIKTIIVFIILSSIDGYVINPIVYGKTNKVHPLIVIMSVFIGGALFGVLGIVASLPTAIILIATYKFFEDDLKEKIEDFREDRIKN